MTREETKNILAYISTVYPERMIGEVSKLKVDIWADLMKDMDYAEIKKALKRWVSTEKYPPTISELRSSVASEKMGDADSPEEAWGEIQKAVQKFGYIDKEGALASLNPVCRRIVERFGWQYFCQMPIDEISTYYAQFRNAYTAEWKKEKERIQIPIEVQKLTSGMFKPLTGIPATTSSEATNVANFEQRQYSDDYLDSLLTDITKLVKEEPPIE
jgi:hypothetical protein